MRIIKYLAKHKIATLLIVCLLIVQAFCDLSLPRYTSDIVDVGIQQQGIQDASCEELSERSYDLVQMMIPEDKEDLFELSYSKAVDGNYALTRTGQEHREELNSLMELPMVIIHFASQYSDVDLDQMKAAYDSGVLSKDDVLEAVSRVESNLDESQASLLSQQAISAATQEYEELGVDTGEIQMNYLYSCGAAMLGLAALGMLASVVVGYIAARTSAQIGADLRTRLFDKVVHFSDAEIQKFSAASLITRGTNDIQLIQMVAVMLLRLVLYAPILAIGGIVMIVQTDLSMGWIVVVAILIIAAILLVLIWVAMPKFKIMQKLIDRVNLVSRETLTGIMVVRAFGREQFEEARFDDASLRLMKTQLFTNRVMTFMMPAMNLVMNVVSVSIIWFGGIAVSVGSLQTGDLIAFITYSMVIIMGFLMIGMISIMLPRADVAASRIDEVLDCKPSIQDTASGKVEGDAREDHSASSGATIAFNDVSFKYGDSAEYVLSHIDFTAKPAQTTAIIGSTGSGKSTIFKLLERFYDVSAGSITLDGVDIRQLSQHELRSQLGYVPQKAFLFSGTIASNVAYSNESMSREQIDEALDIAQASDFVLDKPEGIQSEISEGGTNVSGGQRQRLAIARAIASDARVYLFDDSFSALDYKTDAELRRRLKEQLGDKTVIIVAQRISTVMNADQIIVLEDGHIAGIGTHDQLMKSCPEYQEIALSQLSSQELGGGDVHE